MLPQIVKDGREVCTASMLKAVDRRRISVQCLAEMKNSKSTKKYVLTSAKKLQVHSFHHLLSSFELYRGAVKFRTRVQLVHVRQINSKRYENGVQISEKSSLYSNDSFKEHE